MRCLMFVILSSALACTFGGCSHSDQGTASGTVKLPSGPLTAGSVNFHHPKTGFSITAPIQADGSFEVKTSEGIWIPAGDYQVTVVPDAFPVTEGTQVLVDPRAVTTVNAANQAPIPQKYRSTATSPLKPTVKPGKNPPFEFILAP